MYFQHTIKRNLIVALATMGFWSGQSTAFAAPPAPGPEPGDINAGVQVRTRGPVHEAFAETVTFDPQPGIIVPKTPPADIEELPPDQKPDGDNVAWIPGYWGWDDDDADFLWVSGTWRVLPDGRQWVSGYWAKSRQGVQWTSGYWADASLTEVEYLPEPPESVEAGPNVEAASADQIWLPGNWVWQQNRYSWRPGFWSAAQPNWVWIPSHYLWSPRGYVCVDGYWDRTIDRRGILFAPVSFGRNVYSQPGFAYSPVTVINLGVFSNHLFLRPNYGHYYFGDYYGANYASIGFSPWFSFNSSRYGYDPFYAHQRWHHRNDNQWDRRLAADFARRRDNQDARPPRTFVEQQQLRKSGLKEVDQDRVFATPLEQFAGSKESPIQLQSLNKKEREKYSQVTQQARTIRTERKKVEAIEADSSTDRTPGDFRQGRAKLHQSPFVARKPNSIGNDATLPKGHEFPKTDPNIVPTPRQPKVTRSTIPQDGDSKGLPGTKPKNDPKAVPKSIRVLKPNPKPGVKPSPKPEVKPSPKPGVKPSPRPEVKPKLNPGRKPGVGTKPQQPKPEGKPQPKVESKSERPKTKGKPQSRVERKPEPPKVEKTDKLKTL